ncbi:uncharacterized protein LOC131935769 isoform X3 [Physella acuta]|uniref:uncharacterized protein LOC131935769 isoform X2 n=1 Tax=Physella acuta TaxID=109671 RepID=UPI0027DD8739|nr:uncharacterized protein LOC131935769 isoform X2 [Physella acuta]XP_059148399.1 uncharacterized protein LOC131935769 isoform X3 [Physella acuta]
MEVNIYQAAQCIPLCRTELFTDVCRRVYGDVSQVWALPGHILITTDNGRKLFTFDCKPLSYQNMSNIGCLDISHLRSSLVDVFMVSVDTVALVDSAGQMKFWRFGADFSWSLVGNLSLSTSGNTEVISVAYLSTLRCLLWCEKSSPTSAVTTYCICKRQLPRGFEHHAETDQSTREIILSNCPPCEMLTMSNDVVFIRNKFVPEHVSVHMMYDFQSQLIVFYIGNESISFPAVPAIDFQETMLICVSYLAKADPGQGNLGVRADNSRGEVAVLHSGGQLEYYTCFTDTGKKKMSKKSTILKSLICEDSNLKSSDWFLHKGHVGVFVQGTVHIFRLQDFSLVCVTKLFTTCNIYQVIPSTSPAYFAWILTHEQMFGLQGKDTKGKEMFNSADKLPDDHLLQTDVLRIAHLQEERLENFDYNTNQQLEKLKKQYTDGKNVQPHSQISQTIVPYLEEYWRLESLLKVLIESKMVVMKGEENVGESMVSSLMEMRSLSKSSQHAKMLWLSQVYPEELLNYLCKGITIDCIVVDQMEIPRWQAVLGIESSDLMSFEIICRLLFQLHPDKLLNFVKCAESVSEHSVGVSAFVRKKHTLIYYKTACNCLPDCVASSNPKMAALVKSKLILASEVSNCVEKALKYLLQHELWSVSVK